MEAKQAYATLCRIKRAATKSARYQRHEQAWNNMVHTPLLELLCRRENDTEHEKPLSGAVADWEPMMAATIAGDSIPRLSSQGGALACSVSVSSLGESSLSESSQGESSLKEQQPPKPGQVHSSSDSKKIDYALVLELPDDSTLSCRIRDVANAAAASDPKSAPHLNQTTYLPVQYTLIAVSIETKAQFTSQDPLVQLGIWTAAWHKRMSFLRSQMSWADSSVASQRLVSLPLIQAIGHQWHVFFACDTDSSITVYGPVFLGSTDNLISLYTLLASLRAIKEWVESEFHSAMKTWFKVEQ
ncbi:hypothetical protein F5Y03DRAFT_376564 [Xylaria venustula]|nr:hypothetical protein F5Y03DRAFT_376564 [Xylaria venustula]